MSSQNREMKEVQQWNNMKSIGKKKFLWINGVVRWGLFMAIGVTFTWQTIDDGFNLHSFSNENFVRRLIISLILFTIGGYLQSASLWRKYEKKYND